MTLTQAVAARKAELRGSCSVKALLDGPLGPDLTLALADPTVISTVLALALADVGERVSSDDIAAHRAGTCPCKIGA